MVFTGGRPAAAREEGVVGGGPGGRKTTTNDNNIQSTPMLYRRVGKEREREKNKRNGRAR